MQPTPMAETSRLPSFLFCIFIFLVLISAADSMRPQGMRLAARWIVTVVMKARLPQVGAKISLFGDGQRRKTIVDGYE